MADLHNSTDMAEVYDYNIWYNIHEWMDEGLSSTWIFHIAFYYLKYLLSLISSGFSISNSQCLTSFNRHHSREVNPFINFFANIEKIFFLCKQLPNGITIYNPSYKFAMTARNQMSSQAYLNTSYITDCIFVVISVFLTSQP